jgi:hypothetical protein
VPVLVATDVAARGIDIKDITLVVNYDCPTSPRATCTASGARRARARRASRFRSAPATSCPTCVTSSVSSSRSAGARGARFPLTGAAGPLYALPQRQGGGGSAGASRPARQPVGYSGARSPKPAARPHAQAGEGTATVAAPQRRARRNSNKRFAVNS